MENTVMGKLICEITLNGEDTLVSLTTAPNVNLGSFVKIKPGIGKPFWYWPSIPSGQIVACDFTNAPVVVSDVATNNANIDAITAEPGDVLTYA
jgi:hypothetical protein